MTPEQARAAMKVVEGKAEGAEDGDLVTDAQRRFAELMVVGSHANNATQCYIEATGATNYNTASVQGGVWKKLPKVKALIRELNQAAIEVFLDEGDQSWWELRPLAKAAIKAHILGKLKSNLCLAAAIYVVNRCEGMPTATVDLNVANRDRIAGATKAFMGRMAEEERRKRLKEA